MNWTLFRFTVMYLGCDFHFCCRRYSCQSRSGCSSCSFLRSKQPSLLPISSSSTSFSSRCHHPFILFLSLSPRLSRYSLHIISSRILVYLVHLVIVLLVYSTPQLLSRYHGRPATAATFGPSQVPGLQRHPTSDWQIYLLCLQ